jgi:transcriptional regulator with XRE-family HTH domain
MLQPMDDQRIGRIMRSIRQRKGWRQVDVAMAANCSQNLVSLMERGHLDRVSVRVMRRMFAALEVAVVIDLRWRGAALDRLLDEAHSTLVGALTEHLRGHGWLVEVEITYSEFGERGSIDLLAFHPATRILLVVEAKTDLPSAEGTLRKLDEKTRLAATIATKRFGWKPLTVSRLLVMPMTMTLRRRVERHSAMFDRALPARGVEVRRWIASPTQPMSGIWFFSDREARVPISKCVSRDRVRRAKSARTNSRGAI